MKEIRYMKSGDEIWKFEESQHPRVKNPGRKRWVEGTLMNLDEFRELYPDATEISSEEAHQDPIDLTKGSIGLW